MSANEVDDDSEVVEMLMLLSGTLGIDSNSRRGAKVYKLDEAACWDVWWDDITTRFSHLTGPMAPLVFEVCARSDLGKLEDHQKADVRAEPLPGNFSHPEMR
jgi:hypothetical protein